ncbi:hypothetical protein MPER_06460, partial [Moniliophthora perniciosa FA553]
MAKFSLFRFAREQFSKQKPVVKTDLTGKVVVVIGANTGLGFEACKHFTSMNPKRLIMGCRSKQKGEEAVSKTGYNHAELKVEKDATPCCLVKTWYATPQVEPRNGEGSLYGFRLLSPTLNAKNLPP